MSSMICLDSDFIIDFLRGQKEAIDKLEQINNENRDIVTTSINSLEIFVGIIELDGISSNRIEKTREFFDNLNILDFDHIAAEKSANIMNTLKKSGTSIGIKDSLIAGIVLSNNVTLLTRNIKHFERVSGLIIESW